MLLLVYASLDEKTNQFFTGMCRGTMLAADIDESVEELRKLRQREVEESISGRIKTRRYQRLPGITVEVTSGDKTFKTITTKYGQFSIPLRHVGIDDDGKFNFILYGVHDFSIEARDHIDEIEGRSQRIRIPRETSAALKLVIQRIKH